MTKCIILTTIWYENTLYTCWTWFEGWKAAWYPNTVYKLCWIRLFRIIVKTLPGRVLRGNQHLTLLYKSHCYQRCVHVRAQQHSLSHACSYHLQAEVCCLFYTYVALSLCCWKSILMLQYNYCSVRFGHEMMQSIYILAIHERPYRSYQHSCGGQTESCCS